MEIIEVTNLKTANQFINVNVILNKNLHNYIRPLDNDINEIFDSNKNKNFKNGKLKRWILQNDDKELIGRIVAFTNTNYINKGTDFETGVFAQAPHL